MTIPNIISTIRLMLAPVVFVLLLDHQYSLGLALFIIAGTSDIIDGYLARHYHLRSKLGSYLDPLADKLLVVPSVGYFVWIGDAPWWWFAIILLRDLFLGFGVLILRKLASPIEIFPTWVGKGATVLNMLAIVSLFCERSYPMLHQVTFAVILLASTFTLGSLWQYATTGVQLYRRRGT
ncbi:MAG TPA: CDP-alcohol phosphatidyltransferase family protein [Bdellovibrionota bacterium]|nr:CDP-alcohol phosphatidyltransferase family protein [Bdellovibrionota bacterium]